MGVFSRLFSREGGAVADTHDARQTSESGHAPSTGIIESDDSESGARTSVIEVPTALIELTEDTSSDLPTADPPSERFTDSAIRRSEPSIAQQEASVSRTVRRPPKLPPPPAPRRALKPTPPPVEPAADDVDQAIAALLVPDGRAPAHVEHSSDRKALLETFAGVANLYVQPLRELLFQLGNGPTPRTWADACRPLLSPLIHSATQIGLPELATGLRVLDGALSRAALDTGALVGAASRVSIQEAYRKLGLLLPQAFSAPRASDGRRTILLESLLLQVPGLHRRGIAKLYAAGLCSVAQLAQGTAEELSQATGVEPELARALVAHVQQFERERSGMDEQRQRREALSRLRTLAGRLSQLQLEFERAEVAEDRAAKKTVRRAREAAVLNLQLLVAELGELELLEELKRCSVRAKLERVEAYMQRVESHAAVP